MAWPMAPPAQKSAACPDTDELSWLSEDKEKVLCPCLLRPSEQQHGNGGRRHDGGRCPAEDEGKGSNRKAAHLVSPTANPHHGCHNGYSHEAVDDGAPKQRFDWIERRKNQSQFRGWLRRRLRSKSRPPPTACSRGHISSPEILQTHTLLNQLIREETKGPSR